MQRGKHEGHRPTQAVPNQGVVLSKLRSLNTLAISSLGSLFSTPAAPITSETGSDLRKLVLGGEHTGTETETSTLCEVEDEDLTPSVHGPYNLRAEDYCAAKTLNCLTISGLPPLDQRSAEITYRSSEQAHISTRFPEVRKLFGGLSRSWRAFDDENNSSCGSGSDSAAFVGSMPSMSSEFQTPPLTPDSLNDYVLSSPGLSLDNFDPSLGLDDFCKSGPFYGLYPTSVSDEDADKQDIGNSIYTNPCLQEIKEGKRAERPNESYGNSKRDTSNNAVSDDHDEWYGMEYTLSISSRERCPSDHQSISVGEHSKSRESWAAMHRDRIYPYFECEDYLQWKDWHRFLDRQEENERIRRALEFKMRSEELAWLFYQEVRTRDVLYWQKDTYSVVARDVIERLQRIVEYCPDPCVPPQKHGYAWYLKRSRSLGSIRELKPKYIDENTKESS